MLKNLLMPLVVAVSTTSLMGAARTASVDGSYTPGSYVVVYNTLEEDVVFRQSRQQTTTKRKVAPSTASPHITIKPGNFYIHPMGIISKKTHLPFTLKTASTGHVEFLVSFSEQSSADTIQTGVITIAPSGAVRRGACPFMVKKQEMKDGVTPTEVIPLLITGTEHTAVTVAAPAPSAAAATKSTVRVAAPAESLEEAALTAVLAEALAGVTLGDGCGAAKETPHAAAGDSLADALATAARGDADAAPFDPALASAQATAEAIALALVDNTTAAPADGTTEAASAAVTVAATPQAPAGAEAQQRRTRVVPTSWGYYLPLVGGYFTRVEEVPADNPTNSTGETDVLGGCGDGGKKA